MSRSTALAAVCANVASAIQSMQENQALAKELGRGAKDDEKRKA